MNVNNFSEFYNLVTTSGLQSSSPFDNYIRNVDSYKALCSCENPTGKEEKRKQVIEMYIQLAGNNVQTYLNIIRSKIGNQKISFFNDGALIRQY
jgi:hypothetical protein